MSMEKLYFIYKLSNNSDIHLLFKIYAFSYIFKIQFILCLIEIINFNWHNLELFFFKNEKQKIFVTCESFTRSHKSKRKFFFTAHLQYLIEQYLE